MFSHKWEMWEVYIENLFVSGYYGGQPQSGVPGNVPQGGYGFPAYGYGAPAPAAPPNPEN